MSDKYTSIGFAKLAALAFDKHAGIMMVHFNSIKEEAKDRGC